MSMIDLGEGVSLYKCFRCDYKHDWTSHFDNFGKENPSNTDLSRGVPCPHCNKREK